MNGPRGYIPADTTNGNFVNQASWERPADPAQATQRANERRYGSM